MRCGVGDYTAGLAKALVETDRAEVGVMTTRLPGREDVGRAAGFEVMEPIAHWDAASLGSALGAVRAWKPDIVHVQHPSQGYDGVLPFLLGAASRWLAGVPLAVTLHEPVGVNLQIPLMAALIRSAGALIVVRPDYRELVNPKVRWAIAGTQLRLIPNATTLPKVERTPELVRTVRERYRVGERALVAYFGFVYPARGVHQLFQIADPARHHLVIVGGRLEEAGRYYDEVEFLTQSAEWGAASTMTGFLPEAGAAEVLAAADAVVLPFTAGGGSWNTSLHGARLQGTFVVTTSRTERGYDARQNVYYAKAGDVADMKGALVRHLGTRQEPLDVPTWARVAADHLDAYRYARAVPGP